MTHFTIKQWQQFVYGELDSLQERKMEDHLLNCDHCLDLYDGASELASPSHDFSVEKQVMTAILSDQALKRKPDKPSVSRVQKKTITHFIISAAAAVMLASTGVFNTFMEEPSQVQEENSNDARSITSSLMEQTERLFSQMDPTPKEELE